MEINFRSCSDDATYSSESYINDCLEKGVLTDVFFSTCYESLANEQDKEWILRNLIGLFFRIRIHHKCKTYMDTYRYKKQQTKKQKGVRKNLKRAAEKKSD